MELSLRTPEELRENFVPTYNPFFALLTNTQQHEIVNQKVNIRTAETVGDTHARKIGLNDTERKQVISHKKTKTFNKEFYAIKYIIPDKQGLDDYQDVVNKVVNDNLRDLDYEVYRGTDNNGILISSDPNWKLNGILQANDINSSYEAIYNALVQAEQATGNGAKLVAPYGGFRKVLNRFNADENDTYLNIIKRQFPAVVFAETPSNLVLPADSGFIVIARDFVKFHYTLTPRAVSNGHNDEDEYTWTNIQYGTGNVDCIAPESILVQPTQEAAL
jgi:hypothetical protein